MDAWARFREVGEPRGWGVGYILGATVLPARRCAENHIAGKNLQSWGLIERAGADSRRSPEPETLNLHAV